MKAEPSKAGNGKLVITPSIKIYLRKFSRFHLPQSTACMLSPISVCPQLGFSQRTPYITLAGGFELFTNDGSLVEKDKTLTRH